MIRLHRKTFLKSLRASVSEAPNDTSAPALEALAHGLKKLSLHDSTVDLHSLEPFWRNLLNRFQFLQDFRSGRPVFTITASEMIGFSAVVGQASTLLLSEPQDDPKSQNPAANGVVALLVLSVLTEIEEDCRELLHGLRVHEEWANLLLAVLVGFGINVSGKVGMSKHETGLLADFEAAVAEDDYIRISELMAKLEWSRQLPDNRLLKTAALLLTELWPEKLADRIAKKNHRDSALVLYWLPRYAKIAVAVSCDSSRIWHEVLRQVGNSQRDLSPQEILELTQLIDRLGRSGDEEWAGFCKMTARGWNLTPGLCDALGKALGHLGVERVELALDSLPILGCDERRFTCISRCVYACVAAANESVASQILEACYRKWTKLLKNEAECSERGWNLDYTPLSGAVSVYWQTCRSHEELVAECNIVIGELEEIELRWFAEGHAQESWFLVRLAKLYLLFHALHHIDPHGEVDSPQPPNDRVAALFTDPRITARYLNDDKALPSAKELVALTTNS